MIEVGECVQNGPKFEVPTLICSSYGTPYGCNTSGGPFYNALYYSKMGMYLRTLDMKNLEEPSTRGKIHTNIQKCQIPGEGKEKIQMPVIKKKRFW